MTDAEYNAKLCREVEREYQLARVPAWLLAIAAGVVAGVIAASAVWPWGWW